MRPPVFAGDAPTPCHLDWCPANWIVDDHGAWVGVIDWEFAHPDVRAADVTCHPSWEWIRRSDLMKEFDEGFATRLAPVDPVQRWVARSLYGLTAVVWGREVGYRGFEREGHEALAHLHVSR